MPYIGRSVNYGNAVTQQLDGNDGKNYILNYDTTTDGVVISLDGVTQVNGTDFNILGTALTFDENVAATIKINVIYLGLTLSIGVPGTGTVTSSSLESSFLSTVTSSAELYGFSVDADGRLIVTTTNSGADSISSATYATFKDVVYAGTGYTWTLVGTQLRCTI